MNSTDAITEINKPGMPTGDNRTLEEWRQVAIDRQAALRKAKQTNDNLRKNLRADLGTQIKALRKDNEALIAIIDMQNAQLKALRGDQ